MERNTYSLIFGKEPSERISRSSAVTMISETFSSDPAAQQIFMITGVRGSGKTVLMNEIKNTLQKKQEWIVIELSPERDMLTALAAKLSSQNHLAQIFQSAEINLSFFGLGLSVENSAPVTDIDTALSRILSSLKEHGKKVLILIDEAVSNIYMRQFSGSFQILIREDLPLFLLMTGFYENIYELQNEKSLTFLYRAPKIDMKPLNLRAIAENYQNNFSLSDDETRQMALMTKGYSFAFQVLGYFTFQHSGQWRHAYQEYRGYLYIYVYEKIWSELSAKDKSVAYALAKSENGSIRRIREFLHMETNQFNPYRQRLIRKGIADGSTYGVLHFTLPLFDLFAIENYENEQF